MMDLEEARRKINEIDEQMAKLFTERMYAVKEVALYKKEHGLPILDTSREQQVIEKNSKRIEDDNLRDYYVNLIKNIMGESKKYQECILNGMKVAYSGVRGAFAEAAAKKIFPGARLIPCADFQTAYDMVLNGECETCVLPIENSYAGEVGAVVDLMFSGSLYVNGIYSLPIRQNLIGIKGSTVKDIKKVISHPQALAQCNEYIKAHGFEAEDASNTAVAAKDVAKWGDKSIAAIAGKTTAQLYDLEVLDHDINESAVNTTRFAVFSRSQRETAGKNDSFILMFTVNDEVGALAKAVNIICANGFNMRALRSRPVKNIPWQYYFYVEALGDRTSGEGEMLLKQLSVCCEHLKIVGNYSNEIELEE